MMKKGISRLLWVFIILIIVMVFAFIGYFVYDYFFEDEIVGEDTPKEKQDSEAAYIIEEGEGEGYGEGEGMGEAGNAGAGGEGGGGGEGGEDLEEGSEPEEGTVEEDVEPTATLRLLDFGYEIVEGDLVKIISISYSVYNLNVGPMELELLLFIYDDEDDDSKKGVVRDQVRIGALEYGETLTDASSVSAYYMGDLETEKIFKVTLIGYLSDQSYNLGSVFEEVLFE